MRITGIALAAAWVAAVGCGDGSGSGTGFSGSSPTYEDIAGQYSATVSAAGTDLDLTGTMVMTLVQDGGTFSGTYELTGTTVAGGVSTPVILVGEVNSGTLTAGDNPALAMNWSPAGCGPLFFANSGTYSNALERITVEPAEIPVQDPGCVALVRSVVDTLLFER